jgi:23S rRNA (uracil-5-)-methyltransferase RumA
MNLKTGQKIGLKIKKMGINGEGVANYKGQTVFVPGALKGEDVFAQVTTAKQRYAEAKVLKVNKASKFRVVPECSIYKQCGGCQIMHLSYDKQLDFKTDLLKQALNKFKPEGYADYEIRSTIGNENPTHYRGKLQFQTRLRQVVRAGLYEENSHRLVEIKNCLVQDELTQAIINRTCELLTEYKIHIYDEREYEGVRTVMVRRGAASSEVQMVFIMSMREDLSQVVADLTAEFPQIKTVAININSRKTSEIYGDKTEIIWGQRTITEGVLDYQFQLSPRAFYQLNPKQTAVLYNEAEKALDVNDQDDLIDAYCGVGTIGFAFAKKVKSVRGMDVIAEGIEDAKANAAALGLENTYYETGAAEDVIPAWYADGYRATALVVDPPRTGIDDKLLDVIVKYAPEKMVYVSCNVSTLARDLVKLAQVYDVHYIQSVDMFPHTARTEAVVKLSKKK